MRRVSRFLLVACLAAFVAPSVRAADVEAMLPAETEQVMYLNVKQVLESDLVKKYAMEKIKDALKKGEAQAMMEKLGLDPLKDITSVTGGFWGSDPKDMKGVGIIRGKFDGDKLFKAAEEFAKASPDKLSIVEEGDYKMVKITGDDKPVFASVTADGKIIVVGSDKKVVATSLNAKKTSAKASLNKDLTALVIKQDEKASMFACGMTDGKLGNIPGNLNGIPGIDGDQLKEQIGKMVNGGMTLRVGADVALEITLGMKDADAADSFGANVEKIITLAKQFLPLAAGQQPKAKPIIDDLVKSLKQGVKKTDVTISLKITGDSISKLASDE